MFKPRESRQKCFGLVHMRYSEFTSRRILLELPDRRAGGGPKRRFMDGLKQGMKLDGVREQGAKDRVR